jgi:hypothetical protein
MSYFAQMTNIEQIVALLPWRRRLIVRWHLWMLDRLEKRILRAARSRLIVDPVIDGN